jgi:5-methylcytosine-specific restriction endonuclease McrA
MAWETDHIIAIINGGENRENNLRTLLVSCHDKKTREDLHEKSVIATKRKKFLGLIKSKKTLPFSRGSKWKRKVNGTIVRR